MTSSPDYDAARGGAAFLGLAGRARLAVRGADRQAYLHAMLTNDIASMRAGDGCYAAYLTPQGRMIADMRVLELGDVTILDLPDHAAPTVLARLDQFIFTEDVQLGDVTGSFSACAVAGPEAAAVAAAVMAPAAGQEPLTSERLAGWPELGCARASFGGGAALVVASRDLGLPGFDLLVERPHEAALQAALAGAGAVPATRETAETLRIEAGRPLFGVDMDADTIPLEAGIEGRAISFTKGCYPGQEVIIRVVHRGHGRVVRRLVGLALAGDAVPGAGDLVRAGEREAGRVTSAAFSPLLGRPIALAWAHRDFVDAGTALVVDHAGTPLPAVVHALPFVSGGPGA